MPETPDRRTEELSIERFLRSEIIIVALTTLTGYAIVFAYEAGFCWYYGIPYNLIALNLSTGLGVALALLGSFYIFVFVDIPYLNLWTARSDVELRSRASLVLYVTVLTIPMVVSGLAVWWMIILNVAAFGLGRGLRKLTKWLGWGPKPVSEDEFYQFLLWRRLPPKVHLVLTVTLLILLLSFCVGRYQASVDPHYTYTADGRRFIVLQIYGDDIVAAPYDIDAVMVQSRGGRLVREERIVLHQGLAVTKIGAPGAPRTFGSRGGTRLLTLRQARAKGFWGVVNPYGPYSL